MYVHCIAFKSYGYIRNSAFQEVVVWHFLWRFIRSMGFYSVSILSVYLSVGLQKKNVSNSKMLWKISWFSFIDVCFLVAKLLYKYLCPSVCLSGLGGTWFYQALIKIELQFFLCRFILHMSIYSVNIFPAVWRLGYKRQKCKNIKNTIFFAPS